ncbi:hypothetical protein FE257_010885 [Aspergillus nanangensis]|uniref:Uncharacterized protein n=1 Tax=Aspergillus nanangensis TaxID=2582783 RepID=A0AAD4CW35_ASPNN|nr:hypothetical protein FE257_010885 [Aspergillus nanangensis]
MPTIHHQTNPHHQQHQPVAVVVDARPPPESIASSESEQSDTSIIGARDIVRAMHDLVDNENNPADTITGTTENETSLNHGGRNIVLSGAGENNNRRNNLEERILLGDEDLDPGDDDDDDDAAAAGASGDKSRKHGKRLTTKEEVTLFDICNRHAVEFGQRSNLCKWWKTVTEEFTRDQGHPYSWHSVRRKVEMVTKQRMKYLEELREKGSVDTHDISNPRWREAVDAWIPTWQRWEEAEAQRIERRDSRRPRKRKDRSWEVGGGGGWETPASSSISADGLGRRNTHSEVVSSSAAATVPTVGPPLPVTPVSVVQNNGVRLPPGFDSMFSNQLMSTPPVAARYPTPQPPTTPSVHEHNNNNNNDNTDDNNVMSAVLETLGKLNKHLDAASGTPRSSPAIASLGSRVRPAEEGIDGDLASGHLYSSAVIETLKQDIRLELRNEWRAELKRDRAALEDKLDSVQRTQQMILDMLRQGPA